MKKNVSNLSKKSLMAAIAFVFGSNQCVNAEFNIREFTSKNTLLAHGSLGGNCPGHAEQLANIQAKKDKKKKKKKKASESSESTYNYQIDEEDTNTEESDDSSSEE